MSVTLLVQVIFHTLALAGVVILWSKMKRPPKEDPRLSRGLQLLQSKISVLEDLSDRTEVQVKQLTHLLDQKSRELQQKVQDAESQVQQIEQSMQKSLEVAEIFQDKIPHEEIIERRNTIKYVQSARLAHQGYAVEEICERVNLPVSEVEFIAKVNRDQLMFDYDNLPAWAKKHGAFEEEWTTSENAEDVEGQEPFIEMNDGSPSPVREGGVEDEWALVEPEKKKPEPRSSVDFSRLFDRSETDLEGLKRLDEEFKQVVKDYDDGEEERSEGSIAPDDKSQLLQAAERMRDRLMQSATDWLQDEAPEKEAAPVTETPEKIAAPLEKKKSPSKGAFTDPDRGMIYSKADSESLDIKRVKFPSIDEDFKDELG